MSLDRLRLLICSIDQSTNPALILESKSRRFLTHGDPITSDTITTIIFVVHNIIEFFSYLFFNYSAVNFLF